MANKKMKDMQKLEDKLEDGFRVFAEIVLWAYWIGCLVFSALILLSKFVLD